MAESFQKLKQRCLRAAIIKSVVTGLSVGFFVTGVLLLAFGLSDISLHWAFCILIGAVCAAASGLAVFLLLRPDDMKTAKRFDEEFGLNERLQTMVAFAGQEGDILTLQREDAVEKLGGVELKKFNFSKIWYFIVIAVLSVAILFTGIFVPSAVNTVKPPEEIIEPEPVDEDAFEYDLYMQSAMGELIRNVNESELSVSLKEDIVGELETLNTNLTGITTKTAMKTAVILSVSKIDNIITEAGTFREVCNALDGTLDEFSSALGESIAVYKASKTPLTEYGRVKAYASQLDGLIEIVLGAKIDPVYESLCVPQSGYQDADGNTVNLQTVLGGFIAKTDSAIAKIQLDSDDALLAAFESLSKDLKAVSAKLSGGYRDETLFGNIKDAFDIFQSELNIALRSQCYENLMGYFVRYKLSAIFGLGYSDLPSFNEDLGEEKDPGGGSTNPSLPGEEEEKQCDCDIDHSICAEIGCTCGCVSSGGGSGSGDVNFGSNDLIYDPYTDTYRKYGEVLSEYYAKVSERLLEGNIDGELAKLIEEYFNILFKGIGDSDGNN